jgi:hypothetical protein
VVGGICRPLLALGFVVCGLQRSVVCWLAGTVIFQEWFFLKIVWNCYFTVVRDMTYRAKGYIQHFAAA